MAKSFLLIGIGGSGGKTLRYAWREVDRRLNELGWTDGMPDAWRFLHIDVPSQADVIEGDVPAGTEVQYLGLANPEKQYPQYDQDLIRNSQRLSEIAGWRPDPRAPTAPPYKGAGQRRVIGRVIALSQIATIKDEIESQLSIMKRAENTEKLKGLDGLTKNKLGGVLGTEGTVERGVMVVSSLGGGSGSGIFLDVLEILSAMDMGSQTMPILYAADIFAHLDPAARLGIEANSLAAVSELTAAFEHAGPVAEDEAGFLGSVSAVRSHSGQRVDCLSFFVGRGNGAVEFATSSDVFRSVGKAISAFMLNPGVSEQYGKYVGNNLSAKDLQPAFGLADPTATKQGASSLGYANVTLGRSLFAEYLAERLAKGALETLLRGHRRGLPGDDLSQDQALIDAVVLGEGEGNLGQRAQFFNAAGLHEETREENQVLDALRSKNAKKRSLDQIMKRVVEKMRDNSSEREPGKWLGSFDSEYDAAAREFDAQDKRDRNERALAWTARVQTELCEATAESLGTDGLPVTIKLLDELDAQLKRAADELDEDAGKLTAEETKHLQGVKKIFEGVTDKLITTQHQVFEKAAGQRRDALLRDSEAKLYALAASLMREITKEVIPPLRGALEGLQKRLIIGEKTEFVDLVEQWSIGAVPPHLLPAPNEFLLEDVDEFPGRVRDVLAELLGGKNAEQIAIQEIISGAWSSSGSDAEEQRLIRTTSDWVTANSEVREGAGQPPAPAGFRIELDIEDIRDQARKWVRNRERIGEYMNGSIAQWLDPDEVDSGERGRKFVNSFEQALMSAKPLVTVSQQVYQTVCGEDPPRPAMVVSGIPMASDHPDFDNVVKALVNAGVDEEQAKGLFKPGSSAGSVEVSSFMSQSMHPIVFSSVFEPIFMDWKSQTAQGMIQFWDYRRARPLPSFVPLSPGRQLALVRGYFIAKILGQLDEGPPVRVWTPNGYKEFTSELLGRGANEALGLLPALMESLPLAMVAFANGEPEALDAYRRLLELGASGPPAGASKASTSQDSPLSDPDAFGWAKSGYRIGSELQDWIGNGQLCDSKDGNPGAPEPPEGTAGVAAGTPESRSAAIEDSLTKALDSLRVLVADFENLTPDQTLEVPVRWELRGRLDVAIDQLRAAVADSKAGPGDQDPVGVIG